MIISVRSISVSGYNTTECGKVPEGRKLMHGAVHRQHYRPHKQLPQISPSPYSLDRPRKHHYHFSGSQSTHYIPAERPFTTFEYNALWVFRSLQGKFVDRIIAVHCGISRVDNFHWAFRYDSNFPAAADLWPLAAASARLFAVMWHFSKQLKVIQNNLGVQLQWNWDLWWCHITLCLALHWGCVPNHKPCSLFRT